MNARQGQHPSFTLTEDDAAYFSQIPASFLKLLKLIHYEKMNYREIAQQTDLPAGTVKSRIFRARDMIRKLRAADEARSETWQEPVFQ